MGGLTSKSGLNSEGVDRSGWMKNTLAGSKVSTLRYYMLQATLGSANDVLIAGNLFWGKLSNHFLHTPHYCIDFKFKLT